MWISILKTVGKKIPPWLWMALGVAISYIVIAAVAYQNGKHDVQQEWDASVKRGKTLVEELKKQQVVVNTVVETVVQEKIITIKEKADVIHKEIPVFIPTYRELLPGGFRLLHDAAATNTLPDRSRIAVEEAVELGDVATTINHNYAECLGWRAQVLGWQLWYQEHRDILKPSL